MVHEGPEARAMEQRGIPTEVSERNREIRAQNRQLDQMQARLARLNAWAKDEKKMDETLIAQDEDVSNLYLRYVLASRIFESTVPPNRKDRRLEEATGLMVVMSDYNITDAASYAEAVKQANAKFYNLRNQRKESAELSSAIGARIHAYEDRKKYQKYYSAWSKLSGSKASAYEREHAFELHKYRQADDALNRWGADRERIDNKGWQTVMKHLNKERFALDLELQGQKENIRRLEVVKREFIREKKRAQPERVVLYTTEYRLRRFTIEAISAPPLIFSVKPSVKTRLDDPVLIIKHYRPKKLLPNQGVYSWSADTEYFLYFSYRVAAFSLFAVQLGNLFFKHQAHSFR